jgi:hypothetical protein
MLEFEWSRPAPRLKPSVTAEVTEMLLPMYGWSAPVTKRVRSVLSEFERFTIEAAIELGEFTAADLAEITGLPPAIVERTIQRLTNAGVLVLDPFDEAGGPQRQCRPDPVAAGRALEGAEVFEYRSDQMQFLYLPYTDELLALGRTRRLPRVDSVLEPPMPEPHAGRERWRFLEERIEAGTVADLPADIVHAELESGRLPEACPAYRCTGELTEGGLMLKLLEDSGKRQPQSYPLESAVALARRLESFVDSIGLAFGDLAEEPVEPDRLEGDADARWGFSITGGLARKLVAAGRSLTGPLRLTIADEEARVSVGVRLEPGDDAASDVFALDLAVAKLRSADIETLTVDVLKTAAAAAGRSYGVEVDPEAVSDELWRRGDYHQVYRLRVEEDFPYD